MDYEVIVVGAGPGGSSAAYHLARLGRRVLLLDRQKFPRDKSCGDGLTRSSVKQLADMGVLPQLEGAQKVTGVRIFMHGKGSRDFLYPPGMADPNYGLVVPRFYLDEIICQAAVAAGAEFWQEALVTDLLKNGNGVEGVSVTYQGASQKLRVPVVIAADGASSHLARKAGLLEDSRNRSGVAIRGYYHGIEGLTDLLEIYTPLLDPTDRYLLPSYGWVFPTGAGSANVGVGLFEQSPEISVHELFTRFLEELCREDPRFAHASLEGAWRGSPLRFDFSPERSWMPGLLLVGDAAGTISPFTGEGISYALESGKIAAETTHHSLDRMEGGVLDLSEYPARMSRAYVGYFETGRQLARRYLLIWHVLESTFHNDRLLFALCRQAALFPEALGEPLAPTLLDDVRPWISEDGLPLKADLVAVNEILAGTVRHDWPFLARLANQEGGKEEVPFRPALLLLLSGYMAEPDRAQLSQSAAAVELGYLAALAQMSLEEEPGGVDGSNGGQPANWGNMFALMVGDFLLSKAYELSAQLGGLVSQLVSEALARTAEGRVRELRNAYNLRLTEEEYIDIQTLRISTLFELPCRLGALLGGADEQMVAGLTAYGRNLGLAFGFAEDVRSLYGQVHPLGSSTRDDLNAGIYRYPVLRALKRGGQQGERLRALLVKSQLSATDLNAAISLVQGTSSGNETIEVVRKHAEKARSALSILPDGPARASMANLTDYVIRRAEA